MSLTALPLPVQELCQVVVPTIRDVYDSNAARHDELLGDDAVTFGMNIYRNSWFRLEQEFGAKPGWKTARPEGSLVVSGKGYRSHVYRWGQNELVDLEAFRLDDATSQTKQLIARTNGQLVLDYQAGAPAAPATPSQPLDLRDLVVVHAGNPDDACCAIWVGAPVPAEEITTSPWAWIHCVWSIQRSTSTGTPPESGQQVPHYELPEPSVEVSAIEDESASEA